MASVATGVAVAVVVVAVPTGSASAQAGIQTVNVSMGPDTSVTSVVATSVARDDAGRVSETEVRLDPTSAVSDLPVRVETAWWHDGEAGTDLSDLSGRSGRFTIQVTVHDLTAQATDLDVETDGVRYQQQALVGVPMTVVASAHVADEDRVVLAGDEQGEAPTTNGVLVETSDTGRSVEWAAFLAPPMLSSTAELTLVLDSEDLEVPDIDLTVQPGLLVDPSVDALVDRAFGADGDSARLQGSTVRLVQSVTERLGAALAFVDEVHATLQQDVAQVGEQTYRELEVSASSVVDHLGSTATDLEAILGQTQGDVDRVGTQTHAQLAALAASLDTVLGSTQTPPELVPAAVDGCSVQLPALAQGQPRTVASTVYLADAQLGAIADLFADGTGGPTPTCRDALHRLVDGTVGDPGMLAADPAQESACRTSAPEGRTVACALLIAGETMQADFSTILRASTEVRDGYGELDVIELAQALSGPNGLAAVLGDLRDEAAAARASAGSASGDLTVRTEKLRAAVERAKSATDGVRAAVLEVGTSIDAARSTAQSIRTDVSGIASSDDGVPAVGSWFSGSGMIAALDAQIATSAVGACAVDWAVGLGPDSTAEQIASGLSALEVPGCVVAPVAAAARGLVDGYARTAGTAAGMGDRAGTAAGALDGLGQQLDEVRALVDPSGQLLAGIDSLWDAQAGTGILADLSAAVDDLRAVQGEGGDLAELDRALAALDQDVEAIWPDGSVQPVTSTSACPAVPPSVAGRPQPAGQSVVWLSNRLLCVEHGLGGSLDDLDGALHEGADGLGAGIGAITDRTQVASDGLTTQIDVVSDQVVQEVTGQREVALTDALGVVEGAREQVGGELDAILAGYDLAAGDLLRRLDESMTRSATRSTEVAAVLEADFGDLLVNLGSPDPTSRAGLLGKLHGITTQVGEVGTELASVGATTAAHGNLRSAGARETALRAAQLAAAADRLDTFRLLEQAGDLESVLVVEIHGEVGA